MDSNRWALKKTVYWALCFLILCWTPWRCKVARSPWVSRSCERPLGPLGSRKGRQGLHFLKTCSKPGWKNRTFPPLLEELWTAFRLFHDVGEGESGKPAAEVCSWLNAISNANFECCIPAKTLQITDIHAFFSFFKTPFKSLSISLLQFSFCNLYNVHRAPALVPWLCSAEASSNPQTPIRQKTGSGLQPWRVWVRLRAALMFLTRTLLADDHAQVDGRPLGLRGATVGAAPVGLVEPDLLRHFIVGECLRDRFLDCFNPLLLLPLWLGSEAVTIDFFFFFCPSPAPTDASRLLI